MGERTDMPTLEVMAASPKHVAAARVILDDDGTRVSYRAVMDILFVSEFRPHKLCRAIVNKSNESAFGLPTSGSDGVDRRGRNG